MHVYASLLLKIFGLREHIPNVYFQHVLGESNCYVDLMVKFGRSSRLSVIFRHTSFLELKNVLSLVALDQDFFLVFFFSFCYSTKKNTKSFIFGNIW